MSSEYILFQVCKVAIIFHKMANLQQNFLLLFGILILSIAGSRSRPFLVRQGFNAGLQVMPWLRQPGMWIFLPKVGITVSNFSQFVPVFSWWEAGLDIWVIAGDILLGSRHLTLPSAGSEATTTASYSQQYSSTLLRRFIATSSS